MLVCVSLLQSTAGGMLTPVAAGACFRPYPLKPGPGGLQSSVLFIQTCAKRLNRLSQAFRIALCLAQFLVLLVQTVLQLFKGFIFPVQLLFQFSDAFILIVQLFGQTGDVIIFFIQLFLQSGAEVPFLFQQAL